jgi:uncharacterized membrane protein YfcA
MEISELGKYILLGLFGGVLSGLLGIGGATILVPALVVLFGFEQHMAQGTTLAMMIPPIGLLAMMEYYKAGHVNLKVAGVLCVGMFIGGFLGAMLAGQLSEQVLRKIFGVFMFLIALKMFFGK